MATKILPTDKPEAFQINQDLMQAFREALDKDPAADLLSVVGKRYRGLHRLALYEGLSEAGRYNLYTVNELHYEVLAPPEIDLQQRFPSDYARRYRWAKPKPIEEKTTIQEKPRDWLREKLDAINTASIIYPLSDHASALLQKTSEANGLSEETSLAASLKSLILQPERLFELSIRGVVVKCSEDLVIKDFPDSRDLTEYHNLQYFADHASDLPVPTLHGLAMLGTYRVMFMSYIPGGTLATAWPDLSHEAKLSVTEAVGPDIFSTSELAA
ncbi:hypothetical protein BJX99DRAFT_260442 [Aspergillus californicus]